MESPRVHPAQDHTARSVGVVGLGAVALIHLLDLQGKLQETPYLGIAYVALIVGALIGAGLLIRGDVRRGWLLGGGVAAATFVGYVINRTVGMPSATDDIGNWLEPLGLASIFIEGCVAALACSELARLRRAESSRSIEAHLVAPARPRASV